MATAKKADTKSKPSTKDELADGTKISFVGNQNDEESIPIRLIPSESGFESTPETEDDEQLWRLIRERRIDFKVYNNLMNDILRCNPGRLNNKPFYDEAEKKAHINRLPFTSTQAYSLLKFATEKFVKVTADLNNEDFFPVPANFDSPYLDNICEKIKEYQTTVASSNEKCLLTIHKEKPVLIELIWSYWHEEGMLAQTLHALARRFQNIRNGITDPLANLEIDPLRPLNSILWGYIQDAQHRLTVSRRAYEYDHHYGVQLIGKAIQNYKPASSRSKFIACFHNLLYRCAIFFKEADDLTRRADGFPVLNALKEVHLVLAEGAHNQFGDLPSTARVEMLMEQWILSQPEVREFLGSRIMIPYEEPWMDRVDTMKTLQGWPQTSVSYYRDLGRFGEQLLLSIRYTNWTANQDRDFAANWAMFWRDEIQRYIHSYQSVTGVDIAIDTVEQSNTAKVAMPSILIQQKYLKEQMLKRG
jgi:hypothetical protein